MSNKDKRWHQVGNGHNEYELEYFAGNYEYILCGRRTGNEWRWVLYHRNYADIFMGDHLSSFFACSAKQAQAIADNKIDAM